jgi:hypothetical protein
MDVFWNDIIQPWIYFMYPSYYKVSHLHPQ